MSKITFNSKTKTDTFISNKSVFNKSTGQLNEYFISVDKPSKITINTKSVFNAILCFFALMAILSFSTGAFEDLSVKRLFSILSTNPFWENFLDDIDTIKSIDKELTYLNMNKIYFDTSLWDILVNSFKSVALGVERILRFLDLIISFIGNSISCVVQIFTIILSFIGL